MEFIAEFLDKLQTEQDKVEHEFLVVRAVKREVGLMRLFVPSCVTMSPVSREGMEILKKWSRRKGVKDCVGLKELTCHVDKLTWEIAGVVCFNLEGQRRYGIMENEGRDRERNR
jgi:hypothetical protein